jgi:hypothetical protein
MAVEREHIHEHHDHGSVIEHETASVREPFGIAQFFALGIGVFLVVIGAVGLARAGVHHLTSPRVFVGPFTMTPLLALINVGLGLVAMTGATGRAAARGVCMFLGPLLIAGGIIVLIEPVRALGWNRSDGVIYVILGGVAMIASFLTPAVATYEERRVSAV